MNKEEFFDMLNSVIEELTIDYAQRLRGYAEELLMHVQSDIITPEELDRFLAEQEKLFIDKLESVTDDIEEKIKQMMEEDDRIKNEFITRIKDSFGRIFESVMAKLKALVS